MEKNQFEVSIADIRSKVCSHTLRKLSLSAPTLSHSVLWGAPWTQNDRMLWVGGDFEDHSAPTACHGHGLYARGGVHDCAAGPRSLLPSMLFHISLSICEIVSNGKAASQVVCELWRTWMCWAFCRVSEHIWSCLGHSSFPYRRWGSEAGLGKYLSNGCWTIEAWRAAICSLCILC